MFHQNLPLQSLTSGDSRHQKQCNFIVTALHFIVFIPLLMQGGVPNYGRRDFQRCLDPVGTALTTAHDTEVRNFGLEKLQACFGHGGNSKAPDATGQPRWRRPVKNSALGFYGVLLLLLSGDVSLNPGPRSCKFPCGTCGKPVRGNQAGIQCDSCDRWLHCKCINMSVREYKLLGSDHSEPWFCTTCVLPQFTDSFFNTSSDSAGDLTNEPEGTETLDSPNKKSLEKD